MFDKSYFTTKLNGHIESAGAEPSVEVHVTNGQGHRVRSVVEAAEGYVVLEAYQRRAELTGQKGRWHGGKSAATDKNEVHHAIVAYDSISQIIITPSEVAESPRIGFASR